jgi:hypothetical protein
MTYIKAVFEKKLKELGFSYKSITAGSYIMYKNNDTDRTINIQLILSEPIEVVIHGSRNNNKIQAISLFNLRFPTEVQEQEFLILAFPNTSNHGFEFIIIPKRELIKRLNRENRISSKNQEVEIIFWFMPDGFLYDCTNISIEGEWYFMSLGFGGRMADQTIWDYTEFLNDWNRLIPI